LTGVGGIGKTAVAGRAVARMRADGWWIAEHIGAWNPHAFTTAVGDALDASVHQQLADALRDPAVDDRAKLGAVLRLMASERLLVLFDDFEQNLTTDARAFTDAGFAEIFQALCDAPGTGRVLITCRYPIPDADLLHRVELPALTAAELRRMFLRLPALTALPAGDRRLVACTIGGHPRLIEFVDVLLRKGGAGSFLHVTRKLRALAREQGLDITTSHTVQDSITHVVLLGSRDIVLDELLADLTPAQHDLALQAGLLTAPFAAADLLHPAAESTATPADVDRLRELTLLSPAPHSELVVHPWIGQALRGRISTDQLPDRHQRAADMRLDRVNTGRGRFDDIVEFVTHLARGGDHDRAAAAAGQAIDLAGGEVAVSALLAEVVPLIPTAHPHYLILLDRECEALTRTGLVSATTERRQALLTVAQDRAIADPGNAGYQRNLCVSHNRLGELAVAVGDTTTADQHYRAGLAPPCHQAEQPAGTWGGKHTHPPLHDSVTRQIDRGRPTPSPHQPHPRLLPTVTSGGHHQ
jgi:hypothetical protein